ncbi:MAG: DegV family protein [Firmicutes bacterium]|nr:DegV family protein [Bacillota bacterium]
MSKITIGVDNTCDLREEDYKKYNLEVIYFGVTIGGELYRDTEVKSEDIYRAVEKDGLLPKTNAALESDYRDLFESATKDGGSIIHFSMSDKLSVSHQNALRAAKGLDRVHVIDTRSISIGTGIIAMRASNMVKEGKTVDEILCAVKQMMEDTDISFIIKDLNYLYRGGRASGLKLFGANLLKIRPSLLINKEGKIVPDKKFKGGFENSVKEWSDARMKKAQTADKDVAAIVQSDIDEAIVQDVIKSLKEAGFKEILRYTTGPTLTTHVGRNLIGTFFFRGGDL